MPVSSVKNIFVLSVLLLLLKSGIAQDLKLKGKYIATFTEWIEIYDFKKDSVIIAFVMFYPEKYREKHYKYEILEKRLYLINGNDTIIIPLAKIDKNHIRFAGKNNIVLVKYDMFYKLGLRKKYLSALNFLQ